IAVRDTTGPVIACPAAITIECNQVVGQNPSTTLTGNATATDNCDPNPGITHSDAVVPGNCADNYTVNRTWRATDRCGNTSTCLQAISVRDTTVPVISCPAA